MTKSLAIAQVVSSPWESSDLAVGQARLIANGLAQLGHRVVVLAPGASAAAAAEGRRLVQSAKGKPELLLPEPGGEPLVIAIGEALQLGGRNRSLPAGIAHAVDEALEAMRLDIVHLHDPLPPSLAAAALRNSRALNLGHFHEPDPRLPASEMGKRFGGAIFGRIDMCLADFDSARGRLDSSIPAGCKQLGRASLSQAKPNDPANGTPLIAQIIGHERGSLRNTLRALKLLPDLPWRARIGVPPGSPPPAALGAALRDRVEIVELAEPDEPGFFAGAAIAVIGGGATATRAQDALEAIAHGAVPIASTMPAHDEILCDGLLGPGFTPGDSTTLAAQIEAALDPASLMRWRQSAEAARAELRADRLARDIESRCFELVARRHDTRARADIARRISTNPMIDVDLHMHTDHSHDCATPVEVLIAQAKARGLGAIAVTDHNEISGALEARAKANGIKIIVGEEVKTKDQGEVIGLFIEQCIPRGMTFKETLDAIHAQGGIAYVPHPFDRMHSVPDYEHLLAAIDDIDAIEVYNARVAIGEFNEEAARFAAKYRLPAGAGSDAHVAQGLGSVRIRMRDFDGPEEFLESLRAADIVRSPSSLLFVQALKFIQTKATPQGARTAAKRRRVKRVSRKS